MRCLSVLDLVILFYLFIIFFPSAAKLKRSLLEIVFFVGARCLSVLDLVILFYLFIFFLGREAQKVREWGFFSLARSSKGLRQFFKNVDFSVTYPLKGV